VSERRVWASRTPRARPRPSLAGWEGHARRVRRRVLVSWYSACVISARAVPLKQHSLTSIAL
jgi:hypothetical protein